MSIGKHGESSWLDNIKAQQKGKEGTKRFAGGSLKVQVSLGRSMSKTSPIRGSNMTPMVQGNSLGVSKN